MKRTASSAYLGVCRAVMLVVFTLSSGLAGGMEFAGSWACISCHHKECNQWHSSRHPFKLRPLPSGETRHSGEDHLQHGTATCIDCHMLRGTKRATKYEIIPAMSVLTFSPFQWIPKPS